MLAKLSLLFGALYAATQVDDDLDFDHEFDGEMDTTDLYDGDEEASIDSLLELLMGPNGVNADKIAKIKEIRASGDESEESMATLQALFNEILAQMGSLENSQQDEESSEL